MGKKIVLFCVCLFLISGCAFIAQTVQLDPLVLVPNINIGKSKEVALRIIDEREDTVLGHRGTAYGKAAQITTNQDVPTIIKQKIADGLSKMGFKPVDYSAGSQRTLTVEIRLIEYSTSTGFWTGGIHTKATLKAIAKNKDNSYEQLYRAEKEDRIVMVPTASKNEEYINIIVGDVITKLFQDKELLNLLTSN